MKTLGHAILLLVMHLSGYAQNVAHNGTPHCAANGNETSRTPIARLRLMGNPISRSRFVRLSAPRPQQGQNASAPSVGRDVPRFGYASAQIGAFTITITNDVDARLPTGPPVFVDNGPQVGEILRAHYAPGLQDYQAGRYREGFSEFTYVIDRPSYLNGHPSQAQYLSTAYYLRGMIFRYHAEGVGRLTLAQGDFEAAIQWNPENYLAYLELARLFVITGFKEQAASVLKYVIELKPDESVAKDVEKMLVDLNKKSPSIKEP